AYLRRLYPCWPDSYFSPKCSARLSFLSGCFGAGTYRRNLLKPTAAFGEQSGRLPKSGLLFYRRRSSQIFLDTSTLGTFWESYFSGASTSRPCSTPPFASSKDRSLLHCRSDRLARCE